MNKDGFFHISADFELQKKPKWLDAFRAKYDLPYDYHITFKNTAYFLEKDREKMEKDLKDFAEKHKPIKVIFDRLFIARTTNGWCIMIKARKNDKLLKFQKEISKKFSKYGEFISEERKEHERNFEPHITIGRKLTDKQLEKAKSELGDDLTCDAVIKNLVLNTVKEYKFEEWIKPKNRKFYKLKK